MQVLKEEVREQILCAAEKRFCADGFLETTTRSIAGEVKISVSNLYLYYENKEMLFRAVADPIYHEFTKTFREFLSHNDLPQDLNRNISLGMGKIISAGLDRFLLLAEKSKGTPYEGFKNLLTEELQKHMLAQMRDTLEERQLMAGVFAETLVEGIIHIAREQNTTGKLEHCLQQLADYHTDGIHSFLK